MEAERLPLLIKRISKSVTLSRLTSLLSFTGVSIVHTPIVAIFSPIAFPGRRGGEILMNGERWAGQEL